VVSATLIAYETIRYRHARSWIRSHRGEFTLEEVSRIASVTGAAPADPPGGPQVFSVVACPCDEIRS
jgi:hypothetical protein